MGCDAFEHRHPSTRIVSGAGAVRRLPELLDDLGVRQVLVVCGSTVSRGPQLAAVRAALGDRVAGVFAGVTAHAGLAGLEEGVREVDARHVDGVLSLGGGATIDSAKCIALLRARTAPLEAYRVSRERDGARAQPLPPTMPHVAIPTTAGSSSEIMPWAGIRNEQTREKLLFCDDALIPRVAVLDPEIVRDTGPGLTATSGATALARCVEALYSSIRQPIADGLALQGLRLLAAALPRAVANGGDLAARADTQVGALLSGIAADNAMVSLVHAVGHAVGGRLALQHGIVHAMLLAPAAARYLPVTGALQPRVADALGVQTAGVDPEQAGRAAVDALAVLVADLPIPQRLRDVDVPQDALGDLAEVTVADPMFRFVPNPTSVRDVRDLLAEVW